ncbi:MAG: CRTAC1 family protein [Acidobacteriota bacterium]|nr:CRTAC1 family protein [Acidobacteriota bacterium]
MSLGNAAQGTPAPAAYPVPPKIRFVDIARQAGLTTNLEYGGQKTKKYILESTGSGVAFIDYDNDGWPDILLVNGTTLAGFPEGEEPTAQLYHNNHDGTFTDVTQQAGVALTGWGQGVCAGDYDNDGHTDLFVTFWRHNVLLHNNGNGTFADVTKKAGLLQPGVNWGTGCSFVDYDEDGRLDLFVAQYVNFQPSELHDASLASACDWMGLKVFCGPMGLEGTRNELFHNNGDGTFTNVSESSGVAKPAPGHCFTPLTADLDNDGWPDIYVACDSSPSQLFHNNGNGTFTETGLDAGVAFNGDGRLQASMGADAGDYDGDGLLDIIKTNFSQDTPTLYHNNGDGTFSDHTFQAGIGANTRFLGWGAMFADVDNDGWPDIFMVNGHVYPEMQGHGLDTHYLERKLLFWNERNGKFSDVSLDAGPGVTAPSNSHGLAAADLDNDGSVEFLVNNAGGPPSLLKNYGTHGNWLLVKLIGTKANRDAIGARVTLSAGGHTQMREVRSGGSYLSQSEFRLHFGLGQAKKADWLQVEWPIRPPDAQKFENISANQILTIREGTGIVAQR